MRGLINYSAPINWNNELNDQLVACLHPLPNALGVKRIRDLAGRNDGVIGSGSAWSLNGPPHTIAAIKHNSSNIVIPSAVFDKVDGIGNVTIGLWIMPTALSSYSSAYDTASRQASFFVNSATDGYIGFGGTATGVIFNFPIALNRWQWLMSTYDGTSPKIYLNGRLLASTTLGNDAFTEDLVFGTNPSSGGSPWVGWQSCHRVWARAFTAKQASDMYLEALRGFPTTLNRLGPKRALYAEPITQVNVSPPTVNVSLPGFIHGLAVPTITVTVPTVSAAAVALVNVSPPTVTVTKPTAVVSIGPSLAVPGVAVSLPSFEGVAAQPIAKPTHADLGRQRQGESLSLSIHTDELPDACPTVTFYHEGTTEIGSVQLPLTDRVNGIFTLSHFLNATFIDGHYLAVIEYTIHGVLTAHYRYFEVIGGEPQGSVIAVTEIRRALGKAVIMHREDGYISMGYNPKVEQ